MPLGVPLPSLPSSKDSFSPLTFLLAAASSWLPTSYVCHPP